MTASAWSARTQHRPWRPALAAAPWFESRPKVTSRATTSSGWESTTRPELSTDTRSTTPTSTTSTATCTTGRKVTTYEIRLQSNSTWARILLILFHTQLWAVSGFEPMPVTYDSFQLIFRNFDQLLCATGNSKYLVWIVTSYLREVGVNNCREC